jgi:hypothetical protein
MMTRSRGKVEVDAGPAHHIGDLVRLGQGGGDPVDHEGFGETGRREEGGLRMHVRVDESRDDERPPRVDDSLGLARVVADPRDERAAHSHVRLEHLPGEGREHPAPLDEEGRSLETQRHPAALFTFAHIH